MSAMFKLCAILALAAPFASALTITSISGNVVSEGSIEISWTTSTSDAAGTFSIELTHPSFNDAIALANNVDSSSLSTTVPLPNVPAQDGYTIEFVAIDNINDVFSTSNDFAIGAVSAVQSETITGASSTPSSKSSASASRSASVSNSSGSASGNPISTKPALSSTPTGFGTTAPASASTPASTSAPSTSATGTSGARALDGSVSLSGALLVALGVIAGAFAL